MFINFEGIGVNVSKENLTIAKQAMLTMGVSFDIDLSDRHHFIEDITYNLEGYISTTPTCGVNYCDDDSLKPISLEKRAYMLYITLSELIGDVYVFCREGGLTDNLFDGGYSNEVLFKPSSRIKTVAQYGSNGGTRFHKGDLEINNIFIEDDSPFESLCEAVQFIQNRAEELGYSELVQELDSKKCCQEMQRDSYLSKIEQIRKQDEQFIENERISHIRDNTVQNENKFIEFKCIGVSTEEKYTDIVKQALMAMGVSFDIDLSDRAHLIEEKPAIEGYIEVVQNDNKIKHADNWKHLESLNFTTRIRAYFLYLALSKLIQADDYFITVKVFAREGKLTDDLSDGGFSHEIIYETFGDVTTADFEFAGRPIKDEDIVTDRMMIDEYVEIAEDYDYSLYDDTDLATAIGIIVEEAKDLGLNELVQTFYSKFDVDKCIRYLSGEPDVELDDICL